MIDGIHRFFRTIVLAHRRHVGFRGASSRNNLMFERSRRAYNDDMSGTMHGGMTAAIGRGGRDHPVVVQPRGTFSCTSCQSDRQDREIDEYVGLGTHRLEPHPSR
jgi:hypothetical protein